MVFVDFTAIFHSRCYPQWESIDFILYNYPKCKPNIRNCYHYNDQCKVEIAFIFELTFSVKQVVGVVITLCIQEMSIFLLFHAKATIKFEMEFKQEKKKLLVFFFLFSSNLTWEWETNASIYILFSFALRTIHVEVFLVLVFTDILLHTKITSIRYKVL